MTITIENLFFYSAIGSDLLVLLLFILFLKNYKKNNSIILIAIYIIIALILGVTGKFVTHDFMFYAYGAFTFIEYILFSTIFYLNIKSKIVRKVIFFISIIFTVFLLIYYSQMSFRSIDSIPIGVETIFILLYAFYYLFEQMNDLENSFIYNKYHFWLIIGIMLYLAGSFFIYVFANQVDEAIVNQFWLLTNVFYIIKNIFFAIAFLILVKQSKVSCPKSHKNMYPYLN
jgi:hypothetical protein